jgi:hypothetical protein
MMKPFFCGRYSNPGPLSGLAGAVNCTEIPPSKLSVVA